MGTDNDMDLAGLRLFATVAEMGSLSRAAVALETQQPALSRRMAAVERAWGGQLFHRTGRGVVLTELGERVLPQAVALLEDAKRLAAEISGTAHTPRGVVKIASLPSISILVIPWLLQYFTKTGLDIRLEVLEGSSGQIEDWTAEGRADISILYRYGPLARGETGLMTVESCLVGRAGDTRTANGTIPFAELDGLPLVLPPHPNATRRVLDQISRRLGVRLRVVLEAASTPLQKRIPELQGYYTIVPFYAVAEEVQNGRLQASEIVAPSVPRVVAVGHSTKHPLSSAAREVLRLICLFVKTNQPAGH